MCDGTIGVEIPSGGYGKDGRPLGDGGQVAVSNVSSLFGMNSQSYCPVYVLCFGRGEMGGLDDAISLSFRERGTGVGMRERDLLGIEEGEESGEVFAFGVG